MLHFFRTHQKYFFLLVTIVIVISFSFFGTYGAIDPTGYRDQEAFVAIDGTRIYRSDLEELVSFISTDSEDKVLFGGEWGPNFFNNGVISKDFLQTGLASILVQAYKNELAEDYIPRHKKEKSFQFYRHPQADFITLESAWSYFSPGMKNNVDTLVLAKDPLDASAFDARVNLFLAGRRVPASTLKQILRFQENQHSWITPDPQLQYLDLSLFGYHTVDDWFGPRFTRLVAEFIINASKVAEKRGYRVSKEEALADLMRNSELSYQQNSKNPAIGVTNSTEYFLEQLRKLNMDPTTAAKVWSQVLLFRQLFHDAGSAVFVDTFAYSKVNEFVGQEASGDLYQLAPEFRLGSGEDLRKFEAYLQSVSKKDEKTPLAIPKTLLTVDEVKKTTPELALKKYSLRVAQADTKQLEGRVSLKETWNWEANEANWTLLKAEFPELALKPSSTREERVAALDRLDDTTRARVDSFARNKIISNEPSWIETALGQAPRKPQSIVIRLKGGKAPLLGVKDSLQLMKQLDDATIGKEFVYSPDQQRYYAITVIERSPSLELSTYADAVRGGVLEDLAKKKVTDEQLDKIVAAIKADAEKSGILKSGQPFTRDTAATLRFYPFFKESQEKLKKDPSSEKLLVKAAEGNKTSENQFQIEKSDYSQSRHSNDSYFDEKALFGLKEEGWTAVQTSPTGDLLFFQLKAKGLNNNGEINEKISQTRNLLSDSVQRKMMTELVDQFKKADALSLKFLNRRSDDGEGSASTMESEQDG